MDECSKEVGRIAEENLVVEKIDKSGNVWKKVYFGGGTHMQNWLDQIIELSGKENVEVEEADPAGLQCYTQGKEKVYRIWVKQKDRLKY